MSPMSDEGLLDHINEWLQLDTNPVSSQQVAELKRAFLTIEKDAVEKTKKLFAEQISFGTAGLRGPLGYGFTCMNTITVRLTSQV